MDIATYEAQFEEILEGRNSSSPYDSQEYVEYVRMNRTRSSRWMRKGKILPRLSDLIANIKESQNWLLITEPWCGDAAHSNPFIAKLADLNDKVTLVVQNRDAPDSEIEKYLTNGGKSIPMLIVRDESNNDLFTWGPRPKEAQEMYLDLRDKNSEIATILKELQLWYNKDKGTMIQEELYELFNSSIV